MIASRNGNPGELERQDYLAKERQFRQRINLLIEVLETR